MSKISYLEPRNENDPFHSVMGVVEYFSNSTFVSTKGSEKKPVENVTIEDDVRDDNTKRVVFHPSIFSLDSGEDLAFDPTKVYNANHRQESGRQGIEGEERDDRGILSNANSKPAPKDNLKRPANEVYNGMSRRCRADLLRDDDSEAIINSRFGRKKKQPSKKIPSVPISARARSYSTHSKTPSFLQELKVKVPGNNGNQTPSKVASRWLRESQGAEDSKTSDPDAMNPTGVLSPKKYSVSKINQARTGPTPKLDDFANELKQWHKEYSLRNVEKPREITVTTTVKKLEQEQEAHIMKETDKAAAEAKKALAKVEKVYSKKKKEEKAMKKQMKKEAKEMNKKAKQMAKKNKAISSVSPATEFTSDDGLGTEKSVEQKDKEKKKFWKIPKISKRKPKNEGITTSSKSVVNDSDNSGDLGSSEGSVKVVPMNSTLGITQNPMKVPMKGPGKTFEDTLNTFFELQSEERKSTKSDVDGEKSSPSEESTAVIVETVISGEEESSTMDNSEAQNPKLEPDGESPQEDSATTPAKKSEDNPCRADMFSELLQTDSWLEKTAGLFKTDENIKPPVLVVEVDKYDMDKYEAAVEVETVKSNDCIEAKEDAPVQNEEENEIVPFDDSCDDGLQEEEEGFLQSHCPCMISKNTETGISNTKSELEFLQQNELSWYQMASGYFSPKAQSQVPTEEDTESKEEIEKDSNQNLVSLEGETVMATPITSNGNHRTLDSAERDNDDTPMMPKEDSSSPDRADPLITAKSDTFDEAARSDMFVNSLLTNEDEPFDVAKSETFEDSIITKKVTKQGSFDDTPKLTKIESTSDPKLISLMDLEAYQSESQSCADSRSKKGSPTKESHPCSDSKQSKKLDSPLSKPADTIAVRKKIRSAKTGDSTEKNDDVNAKSTNVISTPQQQPKSQKKRAEKNAANKSKKKKSEKGHRITKKEQEFGATLFGRLDPVSQKKHKKKQKSGLALF